MNLQQKKIARRSHAGKKARKVQMELKEARAEAARLEALRQLKEGS
jgi:hypothetical protein